MTCLFTESEQLEICRRYENGENMRQIAETVFCDPNTISKTLKRHGVKSRKFSHPPEIRQQEIDAYKTHRHMGNTQKAVAAMTGLTRQQVRDILANERRRGRL